MDGKSLSVSGSNLPGTNLRYESSGSIKEWSMTEEAAAAVATFSLQRRGD